jgi:hypothetical protein
MSRVFAACAILFLANHAFGEDKPKPNTLTPKEISEGWVLLFDGETTCGWKVLGEGDKEAKKPNLEAKNGTLRIAFKGGLEGDIECGVMTTSSWYSFDLSAEYRSKKKSTLGVSNGFVYWASYLSGTPEDEWKEMSLRVSSSGVVLSPTRGNKEFEPGDFSGLGSRNIFFFVPPGVDSELILRNVKLRPLETKPLFNGKDLSGWSVNKADPKRMASKWEVTKDGELSLKNGPGDLVSDKQFDNFVLQLECKTFGTGLNSGVFFRNIPGQYQNGYECQIQNSFKDGDRTKPSDFGTGAIYRRVPARKVVSNDNEWFTITLVADENRISTWVNGYTLSAQTYPHRVTVVVPFEFSSR